MAGATSTQVTGLAINGTKICFVKVVPYSRRMFVDPNGEIICGDLDHNLELVSPGIEIHGFKCLLEPHPGELDILVPLIGYAESPTDTFTPTDTLTEFTSLVRNKTTTNVTDSYANCKVNEAIFRGQKGSHPLSLELDIWSLTMTEGSTFSPSTITEQAPYAFTRGALSLRGTATAFSNFVWIHRNHLQRRFNSSVTADVLQNTQRTVHFGCNTPYTDDEDDIKATFNSSGREAGIAGSVTFTNSTKSLALSMPKMLWEGTPSQIGPKDDEVRLNQFYKCYSTGGGAVCTITQDNTA
jgi:hypothetical protein